MSDMNFHIEVFGTTENEETVVDLTEKIKDVLQTLPEGSEVVMQVFKSADPMQKVLDALANVDAADVFRRVLALKG